MKKLLYIALAMIAALASSCSMENNMGEAPEIAEATAQTENRMNAQAHTNEEQAYIRLGLYETVPGYNVEISNVEIINAADANELPSFGTNLEGATISNEGYAPTFDTEYGEFTEAVAGMNLRLTIRFDAVLTAEDGSDQIRIQGVEILDEGATVLKSGMTYDKLIKINAKALNLNAISFDATVAETENATCEN